MLVGSAAGHGIAFLLTPLLSRLYSPTTVGTYSTVLAVASALIGFSTLRLETFSLATDDDDEAAAMCRLALLWATTWSLIALTVGVVAVLAGAPHVWVSVGVMVFAGSLQPIGAARLVRETRYRQLALANFGQGAGMGSLQTGLGVLSPSPWSLIAGFSLSRTVWLPWIVGREVGREGGVAAGQQRTTWHRRRRSAWAAGLSALVNSAASQLPILLTAWFYGAEQVGLLALAIRLLVSPLGIVGEAAAAANIGEVSRLLRARDPGAVLLVRRGMRDLFLAGVGPCALVAALSIPLAPTVLGDQWADAGPVLLALTAGTLAQFVVAPFSQLLNLTGRTSILLRWDVIRFTGIGLALAVPSAMQAPYARVVGCYSGVLVALYLALGVLVVRAVTATAPGSRQEDAGALTAAGNTRPNRGQHDPSSGHN